VLELGDGKQQREGSKRLLEVGKQREEEGAQRATREGLEKIGSEQSSRKEGKSMSFREITDDLS